jgi:hypothetical protein
MLILSLTIYPHICNLGFDTLTKQQHNNNNNNKTLQLTHYYFFPAKDLNY